MVRDFVNDFIGMSNNNTSFLIEYHQLWLKI